MNNSGCVNERQKNVNSIVQSTDKYKIIIAGAGTGKTYIFKKILENKQGQGKCLALTFINNLANDMSKELDGLAESRTFHSFCKKLLHKLNFPGIDKNFIFYPSLTWLISSDYLLLKDNTTYSHNDVEKLFNRVFRLLEEDTEEKLLDFFIERANYYNAIGFDDSVYRVLIELRKNKTLIPKYSQIVVDEFQDFNKLEVGFIKTLESKSPTLIVGDDDQAIYEFKHATPKYIREIAHSGNGQKYKKFNLPYCSRCPKVIIDTVNHIISNAIGVGCLKNRVQKEYECYLPDKASDSKKYPKIKVVKTTVDRRNSPYISKYIEKIIKNMPDDDLQESLRKNYQTNY